MKEYVSATGIRYKVSHKNGRYVLVRKYPKGNEWIHDHRMIVHLSDAENDLDRRAKIQHWKLVKK